MSIRDLALGALADEERARAAARVAKLAADHQAAGNRSRNFLAGLGITDVIVDGPVFILTDEDIHGIVDSEGAIVRWWCQEHLPGQGGTYDSIRFHDLPSLGRALNKIDRSRAAGHFHQDPPKRTETP